MRTLILAASVALALSGLETRAASAAAAPAVTSQSVSTATSRGAPMSSATTSTTTMPESMAAPPTNAGTAGNITGTSSSATGTDINNSQPHTGTATGTTAITNPDGTVTVLPAAGAAGSVVAFSTPSNAAAPATPSYTIINTPLLDQAAREGRAKEARRRPRGEEPRVYGIAPRTDNDLTWQMPDDRVIRY